MANLARGQVEIELDRPRIMQFTLESLFEIMDQLGLGFENIDKLEDAMWAALRADKRMLRFYLWVGLKTDDPELTEEHTGSIIPALAIGDVFTAMTKALGAALPEPVKETNAGNPKKGTGAGRSHGPKSNE